MMAESSDFNYTTLLFNYSPTAARISGFYMPLAFTISIPKWNVEEFCGYKPITTFWQDFSIADKFGTKAITDTFEKAFKEWKGNYKYLTELVLVLNHKIWQFYKQDKAYATLYNELYEQASNYAENNLKGKELNYYFTVTD